MDTIFSFMSSPQCGACLPTVAKLFNDLPVGFCLLDRELRFVSINRWLAETHGLSVTDHRCRLVEDVLPTAFPELGPVLHRVLQGEPVDDVEIYLPGSGAVGQDRVHLASLRPVCGADGGITGILASVIDITQRKQVEAALIESEDHYRHAVELNPQMPWTADPSGNILEVGTGWLDVVGVSQEELLGVGWLKLLHPDDVEPTMQAWAASLATGEPSDSEYRVRLADGSYRWCRSRAAARRNEAGAIIRWYGTVEDIQDRKVANTALRESEEFARSVLESSPDCVKVLDLEGRLQFMNGPGLCIMEIDDFAPLQGQSWRRFWPRESDSQVQAAMDEAREGRAARFSAFCPTAKGTPRWWDVCVSPIPGPDGRPARLLATSRDITETVHGRADIECAHREAEAAAERLAAVLESTTDSIIVLDPDWRITYLNRRAYDMVAGGRDLLGINLLAAFPEAIGSDFERHYRDAVRHQSPVQFEAFLSSLGLWLEVHAYPSPNGLSIFFRDVSERRHVEEERRRTQEQLAHLARHDPLTGLANRLHFQEQLERAIAHADCDTHIAVLCLDLDYFKAVNDTLGHPAGDGVLRQVAERLRACVRSTDVVGRFGGDEFAIIQAGVRRPEDATTLAERLVAALGEPYDLDGRPVVIGASVGVAFVTGTEAHADEVFKNADIALYRAKADGRGTYRFFESGMDERLHERQALKIELQGALNRRELELHYQPLVDLESGRVSSFEALLRWRHPARGFISPADFIPVAEETGTIQAIGTWVLHQACRAAVEWPPGIGVAVNLSPVQFRSRDLVGNVAQALSKSGLEAGRLHLEITESVLLQDSETNLAILHTLRELGVKIAMDDFGTGYSSLGYLRSFPFDKIKIDRSFIGDLPEGQESGAIVRAVTGLGSSLGIATTAEGIETQPQLAHLLAEGCNEGQGYLFSRPVPGEDVIAVIDQINGAAEAGGGGCTAARI